MKTTVKKYTWADYATYRKAFIADGMKPLTYIDWLRVQIESDKYEEYHNWDHND